MSQSYSNIVDPNLIASGVNQIGSVIKTAIENVPEIKKELKFRCGRRPILKKKQESTGYNDCRELFYREILESRQFEQEIKRAEIQNRQRLQEATIESKDDVTDTWVVISIVFGVTLISTIIAIGYFTSKN